MSETSKPQPPTISIGTLIEHLRVFPADYELSFGGLEFYRLKQRAPKLVHLEFSQTVYLDDRGRVVVENHE